MSFQATKAALGLRVATLRHRAGLTQVEFAKRVGVASVVISRLERGVTAPSLCRLAEIAQALALPLASLFNFEEPEEHDERRRRTLTRINYLLRERTASDVETVLAILQGIFKIKRRERGDGQRSERRRGDRGARR